jgi:DNA-binding PadR family transcriptional regulator
MKGEHLGEFEELVLLSVRINGDDASGATIQEVLETDAGRPVSLGAIYAALDRLARKRLVDSELGDPTPKRGGRRKRYYTVTPLGLEMLEQSRNVRDAMWKRATEASREERATR